MAGFDPRKDQGFQLGVETDQIKHLIDFISHAAGDVSSPRFVDLAAQGSSFQKGDFLELPTADPRIYAYLRSIPGQNLLAVMNLSKDPIQDYVFCLSDGPFTTGSARELLYNNEINAPNLNSAGGFDHYKPNDVLDPYSTFIIELD